MLKSLNLTKVYNSLAKSLAQVLKVLILQNSAESTFHKIAWNFFFTKSHKTKQIVASYKIKYLLYIKYCFLVLFTRYLQRILKKLRGNFFLFIRVFLNKISKYALYTSLVSNFWLLLRYLLLRFTSTYLLLSTFTNFFHFFDTSIISLYKLQNSNRIGVI